MTRLTGIALAFLMSVVFAVPAHAAPVKPGDFITPDNAASVVDLVSPGNFVLVRQGMQMRIVPTGQLDWPPSYKAATEKYSSQVALNQRGELQNYVAGLPFPFLDPNDPQVATKVVWNFSYRPENTDQGDIRNVETAMYRNVGSYGSFLSWILPAEVNHSTAARVAFYNNVGRTEVPPIPTDPLAGLTNVRYRFLAGPILEGGGSLIRLRYLDPGIDDDAWYFYLGRVSASKLSAPLGATTLDPDSYSGFAAKVEDFNYQLLGIKPMLASVHAASAPAKHCQFDNGRTVCPENWEMRQLYIIAATAKPRLGQQRNGIDTVSIPRRILYIDSEGWFITASDQYDWDGVLWKTLAIFNAYRDRGMPEAHVAIYPFKRMFETAIVDEDIRTGMSSVSYMPGSEDDEHEGWVIDSESRNRNPG
ncbi:MAG TPA: DUF1329 domain-containing protein [Candidatus Binataceae bacterium]|nr:DUF1329 domain-containing protein [Candidatus Binataceae bacterium]